MTELTFLGTGTSVGVPIIGCDCKVCRSDNPHNTRTRSSVVVQSPLHTVLVDFGPDLRQQALREDLTKVDAVLVTHQHLDHIMGFDDLRAFCWHRPHPMPLFGGPETLKVFDRMFPWAFGDHEHKGYVRIDPEVITGAFTLADLTITPLPVVHGPVETLGYRFDLPSGHSLAYLSDVKSIPPTTAALMTELDALIIDALRPAVHPSHMSHEEALHTAEVIGAEKTLLTHLTHDRGVEDLEPLLPPQVSIAHDGMKLRFQPDKPCSIVPSSTP